MWQPVGSANLGGGTEEAENQLLISFTTALVGVTSEFGGTFYK